MKRLSRDSWLAILLMVVVVIITVFAVVWQSQKDFLKLYTPYMKLQSVDAEVDVNAVKEMKK